MDVNTSRRRGPGLRLEIGIIGAVIMALVLMVGAAQGLGRLTNRQWAQTEEEESWSDTRDSWYDGSVTLKNGSSWLDATGLSEIDVTTDDADFEIRYVDTSSATLDVDGEIGPHQRWLLQREGQRLTVTAQWDPEGRLDESGDGSGDVSGDVSGDERAGGSAAGGGAGAGSVADGGASAEPTDQPTQNADGSPTQTPTSTPTQTQTQTPEAPPTDASEQKLVKVTLTLPESLRSEPGVNTYRVLGGSLTTAKAFGDTSLVLLGGTADIRGDTRYFSATVASGNLEFLVSDAESVDLEASGEAAITGKFAGYGPQYVRTILNGGTMDLTFPDEMTLYDVRVDNQFGELHNLLKKSATADDIQYPDVTVEGSVVGGSLTLR